MKNKKQKERKIIKNYEQNKGKKGITYLKQAIIAGVVLILNILGIVNNVYAGSIDSAHIYKIGDCRKTINI